MIFFSLFYFSCTVTPPPVVPSKSSNPNILLITIDTLRADRLGFYGDPLANTPNLDRLAEESVVFAEAHSVAPLTLPSHSSILTGLYPKNHGIRDNAGFRLRDEIETISEVLQQGGYETAAFVSAFVLSHSWGLDQGFALYDDPFHPQDMKEVGAFGEVELPAVEVLNRATNWWQTESQKTKFAWVHLYDPHAPWQKPENLDIDPYRAEIAKVDRLLRPLLSSVDDDDLIIVTSDHGESLWEGGEREHSILLGRSVTRVPLLIRPPKSQNQFKTVQEWNGFSPKLDIRRPPTMDQALELGAVPNRIRAGKIVTVPVSSVDIAPTIADYAKREMTNIDGESLTDWINETKVVQREKTVYAESIFPYFHYGWYPLTMVQDENIRLEKGKKAEWISISDKECEPNPTLEQIAEKWFGDELPQPASLDGTTAAALQQLGYLTDPVQGEISKAPDPRDKIERIAELRQAEALPLQESIVALEKLIAREPSLIDAQLSLSYQLSQSGELQKALDICIAILEEQPLHSTALNNAVLLSSALDKSEQAIQFAKQMLAMNAEDIRPYRYLAAIYMKQKKAEAVIDIGEQGLTKEKSDPNLNYLVALSHLDIKEYEKSIPFFENAEKYGARATDIPLWLGIASQKLGKIDQAKTYYEQANKALPMDLRPSSLAGSMLAENNRCQEARVFLVNAFRRGARTPDVIQAMEKCNIQ